MPPGGVSPCATDGSSAFGHRGTLFVRTFALRSFTVPFAAGLIRRASGNGPELQSGLSFPNHPARISWVAGPETECSFTASCAVAAVVTSISDMLTILRNCIVLLLPSPTWRLDTDNPFLTLIGRLDVPQHYGESAKWFHLAADQDNPAAKDLWNHVRQRLGCAEGLRSLTYVV